MFVKKEARTRPNDGSATPWELYDKASTSLSSSKLESGSAQPEGGKARARFPGDVAGTGKKSLHSSGLLLMRDVLWC